MKLKQFISSTNTPTKVNQQLSQEFGFNINNSASSQQLENLIEECTQKLVDLRQNNKNATTAEYAEQLLIKEAAQKLLKQRIIVEGMVGPGSNVYRRVLGWLTDYACRSINVGDSFDVAIKDALKQYQSSPYRFPEIEVEHDLKKAVKACYSDELAEPLALEDYQAHSVEEKTHPNSKIYDECRPGYRKVPGKKRGEPGSCREETPAERALRTSESIEEADVLEGSDISGLISAASKVQDYIITAKVDGTTKKFRVRGMTGPRAAEERFLNHVSATVLDVKPVEEADVLEDSRQPLSVQQLAAISDEALDQAYGYGRSTPGNSFGWQANLMSAAYAKKLIDAGVTDIEKISDAVHKGWNVTAQKFVQNPDQFSDTEKLRQDGKLDAKLQQRAKLMKINYAQLDNEEQEKDRVVARALLQAIRGSIEEAAPLVGAAVKAAAHGAGAALANRAMNKMSEDDPKLHSPRIEHDLDDQDDPVLESPVFSSIAYRISMQRLDLIRDYGIEKVMDAIQTVASNVGDLEEIGSSDISVWVNRVEQELAGDVSEHYAKWDGPLRLGPQSGRDREYDLAARYRDPEPGEPGYEEHLRVENHHKARTLAHRAIKHLEAKLDPVKDADHDLLDPEKRSIKRRELTKKFFDLLQQGVESSTIDAEIKKSLFEQPSMKKWKDANREGYKLKYPKDWEKRLEDDAESYADTIKRMYPSKQQG